MRKNVHTIVTAFIGALGGALGGVAAIIIGYFVGLAELRGELLEESRREAYADWLGAIQLDRLNRWYLEKAAEKAEREPEEAKKLREKAQEFKDEFELVGGSAIARIAIYGEALVVRDIVKWYEIRGAGSCDDDPAIRQEITTYDHMRRSLMPEKEAVDIAEIGVLSVHCTL